MLTLVSSYNTLENNLERHEIRERALGEVIKKGLQTLHKGQRIFEPMRGTFSRLDDRISQMESLLIARDTELKDQQADTRTALRQTLEWQAARDARDVIERQQRDDRFEQLLKAVNAAAAAAATPPATTPKPSANHSDDDDDDDEDVGKKVDDLAESVKRLRQEVAEMMADRTHADESVKALIGQAERLVGAHAASSEEVVAKLEQKLSSFYVTAEATASTTTAAPIVTAAEPQPRNNTDWENSVQSTLATIEDGLRSLQVNVAKQPLLDREFFDGLTNETLEAIIDMRIEVLAVTEKSFAKTASRIKESTSTLDEAIAEAVRTIGEQARPAVPATATDTPVSSAAAAVEQLNEAVLHSYTELHAELASLRQLKKLALETSDNVLEVKRGMEYNVHAITAEIGELIRGQGAVIDASLSAQFSQLNGTIQANHNGALANLTAKIETEISQVWRQIGIMFQLVQSTEMSLNKLQEQTEIYVNGTSTVMDGMGGKVVYSLHTMDVFVFVLIMFQKRCHKSPIAWPRWTRI